MKSTNIPNRELLQTVLERVYGPEFLHTPHTEDTADRVLAYWESLRPKSLENLEVSFRTFLNKPLTDDDETVQSVKGFVAVNRIPFHSACAHHLLPFEGHVYIGYLPNHWLAGLSKFPRAVEHFAQRPQTQELMCRNLSDWLYHRLKPTALVVICDAIHTCTTCRGVQAAGTVMTTSIVLGDAQRYEQVKTEFFELIRPFRGGQP